MIPVPYSLAGPFLLLALILICLDFLVLGGKGEMTGFREKILTYAAFIACILIALTYLLLTMGFLTGSYFLSDVYSYSSSGLSSLFKLGGPWISGNGSLLFIALLISAIYFMYRGMAGEDRSPFRVTSYRVIDIILIIFIVVPLLQSPFSEISPAPPDGIGLNPLLQSFWVLIHPPVIFAGYVFVFLAGALFAAALITGRRDPLRSRWFTGSLVAAWLCLAAGIALGGYWSYIVLGWGGYWSWDPVETASLLPWLALTAYFHAPPGNQKLKDLSLAAAFPLVLYATAVTRGGFSPSLHAFGPSPVGYIFIGIALMAMAVFLYFLRMDGKSGLLLRVDTSSLRSLSFTAAFFSLAGMLFVCFAGVTVPVIWGVAGIPLSVGSDFFNSACYPFVIALAAALIGCTAKLPGKVCTVLILLSLAAGGVLALLQYPSQNIFLNFSLPIIAVSGTIAISGLWESLRDKRPARASMISLTHIALIIIVIGVLASSGAETETISFPVHAGSSVDLHGSRVTVNSISVYQGTNEVYYPSHDFVGPEYAGLVIQTEVVTGGIREEPILFLSYYPRYGMFSQPSVIPSFTRDYYFAVSASNSTEETLMNNIMGMEGDAREVVLSGKVVPFVSLLWAGILLLLLAVAGLLVSELSRHQGIVPEPDVPATHGSKKAAVKRKRG